MSVYPPEDCARSSSPSSSELVVSEDSMEEEEVTKNRADASLSKVLLGSSVLRFSFSPVLGVRIREMTFSQ